MEAVTTGGARRARLRAVIAVVLAALAIGGTELVLDAPRSDAVPVPFSATPQSGWRTNGKVYAVLVVGDTVYLGGSFTALSSPGGTQTEARRNLAAIDLRTGAPVVSFRADANGVVRALATDGNRLFVGGGFNTLAGAPRTRLGAVALDTGALAPWRAPGLDAAPIALAVSAERVVVGGSFTRIGTSARRNLAAFDRASGALDPGFAPEPDGPVRTLETRSDGTLLVGGDFSTVSGAARPFIAALDPASGAALPPVFASPGEAIFDVAVSADGATVFGACRCNSLWAWPASGGAARWKVSGLLGDVQAVEYVGGEVYFSFHEGQKDDTSVRLLAADALTGALDPFFRPAIDSFYGVWSLDSTRDTLVAGGEFSRVANVASKGIARFALIGAVDRDPPAPPGDLRIGADQLTWSPVADPGGIEGYRVSADGRDIAFTAGNAIAVPAPTTTPVRYTVRAVDAAGNESASSAPVVSGTGVLIRRAATWRYLDDGSDQGEAWRAVAFDDTAWRSGAAQLGYGDGDEATVVATGAGPAGNAITTYFRTGFEVADPATVGSLQLEILRDDGAVVYLNGTEVARSNMPQGPITAATPAAGGVPLADESVNYYPFPVAPSLLVVGRNVVAVEIHQSSRTSSDISFDLSLTPQFSASDATPPSVPTGLDGRDGGPGVGRTLRWVASSDDVAVDRYEILRDGAVIGTTADLEYLDTVPARGTLRYAVRAVDAAGNRSATAATDVAALRAETVLLARGSSWRYLDTGADPGASWTSAGFDDTGWRSGAAELGYGDGDEATLVGFGTNPRQRFVTTWFRTTFSVADPAAWPRTLLRLRRDDGAAVYLNGTEIMRSNLPTGSLTAATTAMLPVNPPDESAYFEALVPAGLLRAGANVIAVEVHQNAPTSADLSFDLEVVGQQP